MFKFLKKPKPYLDPLATPKLFEAQRLNDTRRVASTVAATGAKSAATKIDVVAQRRREWARGVELARARRDLAAAVRANKISRESLSPDQRLMVESIERAEKGRILHRGSSRFMSTGLGSFLGGLVFTALASGARVGSGCMNAATNAAIRYPALLKLAAIAGGAGVIAVVAAAILWVIKTSSH
jgi:hypothetical protein